MTTTRVAERGRGLQRFDAGPSGRAGLIGAGLMAMGSLISGCQLFGQDPARCDQGVATVRQAIGYKDFASARTWRDYTWKVCDERAIVDTLDKEIVDAEAAAAAEVEAIKQKAAKLAKDRINAAQALWLKFDAEAAPNRTREALDATRKSAKRLERDLEPTYAAKLGQYNDVEYQKRLAALSR